MSEIKIYNFMGARKLALGFSATLLVISIVAMITQGLNFGLDFTGGTLIEVGYEQPADLPAVRNQLATAGYDNAVVQNFGTETDVMIRLQQANSDKLAEKVLAVLRSEGQQVDIRRIEFVGPQVGDELKEQGVIALVLALAVVMIYVAVRFQLKFSIGAVIALIHDVIITIGTFAVLQWEFDLTVLAALLAVIGYSLNDTIVVYDRIRENFRLIRKSDAVDIVNTSLTETLSRTLVTSLTTLIVLVVLFFAGGEMIRGFALALTVGVLIGTYSSIYIAANILLMMKVSKEDLITQERESQEYDTP